MSHQNLIHICTFCLLTQLIVVYSGFNLPTLDASLPLLNERPGMSDKTRLDTLAAMARCNISRKAYPTAKQNISEAYDLAKRRNLEVPYALHWAHAELLNYQKDFTGAYQQMEKTCRLLKKTDRFQETNEAEIFKATMLYYCGDFNKSLNVYEEAIRLARAKGLKGILPACYRGMADVYNALGKSEKNRECVALLIESSRRENNQEFLSRGYFRMGQIKLETDRDFRSSNSYYKEALRIREKQGDSSIFPIILNRISWNYFLLRELDSSLSYFNITLKASLKQKDFQIVANTYGNIGTIYREKKAIDSALYYYGISTTYAMLDKDWETLSWVNKDMSEMFRRLGDYKKAYECEVRYNNFHDSLSQRRFSVGLADARMRYDADTKARELEMVSLKLDHQRYYIFGLAGFTLLILVIGVLLFRQSRLNARRQISEMNGKIAEITQANLRQQMNPHFIFNTLNSIQYYMYQHDKIAVNNYLTKFSTLMRKTLENSRQTVIPLREELDALELYIELESLRFKEKFDYSISVDEEIDPLLYKIPTMLLQPYVENAICHGLNNKEGKGTLKIRVLLEDDYLCCIIEDNGIGREAAMKIKMGKEKIHPPLGTRITESRMELANAIYGTRMEVMYTDLADDQGKPAGTRVEIQIPILT